MFFEVLKFSFVRTFLHDIIEALKKFYFAASVSSPLYFSYLPARAVLSEEKNFVSVQVILGLKFRFLRAAIYITSEIMLVFITFYSSQLFRC